MVNSDLIKTTKSLFPVMRDLSVAGVLVLEVRAKPDIGGIIVCDSDPRDKLHITDWSDAQVEKAWVKFPFKGLVLMWRI